MSHINYSFGTTINCMDGRAVESTIVWMKKEFHFDYVDTITEPGMDNCIACMTDEQQKSLAQKIAISINNHGSRVITVAGHTECAGNPASRDEHVNHVRRGVEIVKKLVNDTYSSLDVIILGIVLSPRDGELLWEVERV